MKTYWDEFIKHCSTKEVFQKLKQLNLSIYLSIWKMIFFHILIIVFLHLKMLLFCYM